MFLFILQNHLGPQHPSIRGTRARGAAKSLLLKILNSSQRDEFSQPCLQISINRHGPRHGKAYSYQVSVQADRHAELLTPFHNSVPLYHDLAARR